tara:strand:- start:224 stop:388 length:165 start_codon:yes stop_codon:yes gene_type:complete
MKSINGLLKKVLTRIDNQKSIENARFRKDMKVLFNDQEMFEDKKIDNKILYLFN